MSKTPFMQLYVADYLADTRHLSTEEHGAYLLLLMTMWKSGGSLPNDARKLARIAGVHPPKWARIWTNLAEFFDIEGDEITQDRLVKEYEKARLKSLSRASAGSKGGTSKALKRKEPRVANATAMLKHSLEPESDREDTVVSSMPRKRASRLPETWVLPVEWGQWAVKEGWPEAVIRSEADRFRDYWIGKSGKDATKADWAATWRNWMRNSKAPKLVNGDGYERPSKSAQNLHAFIGGAD